MPARIRSRGNARPTTSSRRPRNKARSMGQLDELVLAIARHLEVDWQYVVRVEAWTPEQIAEVRSAGRKAGRLLGYKIVTAQSAPDDESRVTIIVAVREAPNAEEDERM